MMHTWETYRVRIADGTVLSIPAPSKESAMIRALMFSQQSHEHITIGGGDDA